MKYNLIGKHKVSKILNTFLEKMQVEFRIHTNPIPLSNSKKGLLIFPIKSFLCLMIILKISLMSC